MRRAIVRAAVHAVLAGALALCTGASARAQPTSLAEARRLFEEGLARADQERWGEAVELFRRSRAIAERPNTVFNLGNALYRLARYIEAARAFEDYLRISDPTADADTRRSAERLLADTRRSLGRLVLTVAPPGADVRIDGQLAEGRGERREIAVDPGEHTLLVSAARHRESSTRFSVLAGGSAEHTVELVPEAASAWSQTRLTVTSNVASAVIRVDGAQVGEGTAVVDTEAGRHLVEVEARGHRAFRRTVRVREGGTLEVQAMLARVGDDDDGGVLASPVFWVVVGVVVAGAAAGTVWAVTQSGEEDPYGGSTGVVLMGLSAPTLTF